MRAGRLFLKQHSPPRHRSPPPKASRPRPLRAFCLRAGPLRPRPLLHVSRPGQSGVPKGWLICACAGKGPREPTCGPGVVLFGLMVLFKAPLFPA